jgi:hypothetical protein
MGRTLFFAMMLIVLGAFPALSKNVIRCDIERKRFCEKSGCKDATAFEEYKIIRGDSYKLCIRVKKQDPVDCQKTTASSNYQDNDPGFWRWAFLGGEAKMAKIDMPFLGLTPGDFLEMRSVLLGSFSSFGKCRVVEQ